MGPRALGAIAASLVMGTVIGLAPTSTGSVGATPTSGENSENSAGAISEGSIAARTTAVGGTVAPVEPILDELDPDALDRLLEDVASDPSTDLVDGEIVVVEPPLLGPPPPPDAATAPEQTSGSDGGTSARIPSISDALTLHSRPESSKTIYLDVDGHVTTGTPFNTTSDPLVTGAYSREPRGSEDDSFSASELQGIVEIWERVAEDYAPWDVDVTTEDPGIEALRRTSPGDDEYGIRVVITHDSAWYGSYGGVAYLYSFQYSSDRPAFVFSDNLGQGNPKLVAEAAAHEAGHSFGLSHDGKGTLNYYAGHGAWAPIMGVGYHRPVTQWSIGDYPGATNTQDDLVMIDAMVDRLAPVLDGGAASPPLGSADSTTAHAITTTGATNVHGITITADTASIAVGDLPTAAANASNLVAEVRLKNSSGDLVASATPASPTDWGLSAGGLASGSYTLEVEAVGWPGAGGSDTGFSSYGSLGQYQIEIDLGPTVPPPTTEPPSTTEPPAPPPDPPAPPPDPDPEPEPDPEPDPNPEPESRSRLTAIGPTRVLDTRSDLEVDRLGGGETVRIDLGAHPDVPIDAEAVVLNVVAVRPAAPGYLSVTPCPNATSIATSTATATANSTSTATSATVTTATATSTVNFVPGLNTANSTIVALGGDAGTRREVCVFSSGAADVILDLTGWLGEGGADGLTAIEPARLVDSRFGLGVSGRLGAGETVQVRLGGRVATDTRAVAFNLTAVRPATDGFLSVHSCELRRDLGDIATSALNFGAGKNRANNAVQRLDDDRSFCVTASTATDILVDLTGEFGPGGLEFVAADPRRVLDTRPDLPVDPGSSIGFDVPAPPGHEGPIPAASVTITAVRHASAGFVTSWDCGPRPTTSSVNAAARENTANGALAAVNGVGRSCLFHEVGGDVIVDLLGWWI